MTFVWIMTVKRRSVAVVAKNCPRPGPGVEVADSLITVLEYLGWAAVSLFGLFGLLGVAAFLGPRRGDPDDDYRVIAKNGKSPADVNDSVNDNGAAEDHRRKAAKK